MILVFDLGGTNTRLAVSRDGETLEKPFIVPTPSDFDALVRVFADGSKALLGNEKPDRVVGGVAGTLNREKNALVNPLKFGGPGHPLKNALESTLGVSVALENDAALAGLAEATRGAGRGHPIVAYLTVGTGVGGARVVNGKIDANVWGFEPGFHFMDAANRLTFEDAVSGRAIERRFHRKPETISDPALWEELAEKLAVGIHNASVFWSPDIVVLGGSMILGDPAISLERVREQLRTMPDIFEDFPMIEKAALGDLSGLYGALELARR